MTFKSSILFTLVFIITSCTTKKQMISFTEVVKGGHSNVETAKSIVIKDIASYNEVFTTINQTKEPNLTIPTIDFENEMIIGLFMGMKNSGGYSIKIDSIISNSEKLLVYVKKSKPKGMATSVMTQPFYLAKIKKTNKLIVFK